MANNPLYPGYTPKDDAQNPFFTGYYPGKPISKGSKYASPKFGSIPEFKMNSTIYDFLDEFAKDAEENLDPLRFPKWLRDKMADDFNSSFKSKVEIDPGILNTELDDYDTDTLPGATSFSVNLDPREWHKDPQKMLKKTWSTLWSNAFNVGDYETNARAAMWGEFIKKTPFKDEGFSKDMYEAAGIHIPAAGVGSIVENPLALMGGGILPIKIGKRPANSLNPNPDMYSAVGATFFEYIRNQQSAFSRTAKFNKFQTAAAEATVEELNQVRFGDALLGPVTQTQKDILDNFVANHPDSSIGGTGATWDSLDSVSRYKVMVLQKANFANLSAPEQGLLTSIFNRADQIAIDRKNAELDMFSRFGDLTKKYNVDVGGALEKSLKKVGVSEVERNEALSKALEKLVKPDGSQPLLAEVTSVKAALLANPTLFGHDAKLTGEMLKKLNAMEATLTSSAIQDLINVAQPGQSLLRVATFRSASETALKKMKMEDGLIGIVTGPIGDTLGPALETRMLRSVTHDICDTSADVGKIIKDHQLIALKSQFYLTSGRVDFHVFEAKDLIDQVTSGKFIETFVWKRINKIISPYKTIRSPGEWVSAGVSWAMEKTGLNASSDDKPLKTIFAGLFRIPAFSKIDPFINKFSVDIGVVNGVNFGALLFTGGKHFQSSFLAAFTPIIKDSVNVRHVSELFKQVMAALRAGNAADIDNHWMTFITALNLPFDDSNYKHLRDGVETFCKYLNDSGLINPDFFDNDGFAAALFNALNSKKDLEMIGVRYMGFLNRIGKWSNKLQSMKYIKMIVNPKGALKDYILARLKAKLLKEAAQKAIERILLKLGIKAALETIAQAIAAASNAAAPVIGQIVAEVIIFIVSKLIDKVLGFLKGMYDKFKAFFQKGELDVFIKDAEKKQVESLKKLAKLLLLLLIPFMFLGDFGIFSGFHSVIPGITLTDPFSDGVPFALSTFASTDPSRVNFFITQNTQNFNWDYNPYADTGSGGGGGNNNMDPERDGEISANEGCFSMVSGSGTKVFGTETLTLTEWTPSAIDGIKNAINELRTGTGGYMDRLCGGGNINLHRVADRPGYCGWVVSGSDIIFTSTCSLSSSSYTSYLFAHESGHIYDIRVGKGGDFSAVLREGTLPTYPGNCSTSNSPMEDFAETIGDYIFINKNDCGFSYGSNEAFWNAFPKHLEYAKTVLFK